MEDSANGPYDLLLLLDATASMGTYVSALNKSLQEAVSISALTSAFERIGVLAYRDYDTGCLIEWSGWCCPSEEVVDPGIVSQDAVLDMARNLTTRGGYSWPEASKTGLACAYSKMRSNAKTIILLYADAAPHFRLDADGSCKEEQEALNRGGEYADTDPLFADWVSAARTLASGPKKATVFSMIHNQYRHTSSSYLYLSTVTGGNLFSIQTRSADIISQLTLGVLLTWMRLGKTAANSIARLGEAQRYRSMAGIHSIKDEDDALFKLFVAMSHNSKAIDMVREPASVSALPTLVQARGPEATAFAKKYTEEAAYRKIVFEQLRRIIQTNVAAISINPVFGSLWRTVCNDRGNESRNQLLDLFGLHVEKMTDMKEKARIKSWLEESYNYADEINYMVKSVAAEDRFPLVFLDPTAGFTTPDDDDVNPDKVPINKFTRAELLEIGRSCDYKILRRLGKVLTRLTYVEREEDLPEHIKSTSTKEVPRIPMSLAEPKLHRKFWKVLLHAVLPGTMLTARPAAVLAALALRMGMAPLREAADNELMCFTDKWNNLDVPETWNLGCLNLLLDADQDFEHRISEGVTSRPTPTSRVLIESDRDTFRTLVDYKMLELNMQTTLNAKTCWQPNKTQVAMGPLVVCRECQLPRSVTMMSTGGLCGLCNIDRTKCICDACSTSRDFSERCLQNVSKAQSEESPGCWVECGQTDCRVQYVVYNPASLNVRPKCFYCRHKNRREDERVGLAPFVECTKCLSRIVWPEEYRPQDLDTSTYRCSACVTGVATIVTNETSALKLSQENGRDWLLRNDEDAIHHVFDGRTVFHIATNADLPNLPANVEVLPSTNLPLTIEGKLVHNNSEIKEALRKWVVSRRTEPGCCSLCFSDFRKSNLRPACRRSGCHQLICDGCRDDWYGINARGRIINISALSCPFCRRLPAPKAVHNFRLTSIGNLSIAVKESGSWIYAWCADCRFAKPYIERVCAAGPPPELTNWACDECNEPAMTWAAKIRMCPSCDVATEKSSGCDHITCPCGTHWCYACGEAVDSRNPYEHMNERHGGLWGDDEYPETDEDDYGNYQDAED